MARRNIASQADQNISTEVSTHEEGAVKFISKYREFHFAIKKLDENGKVIMHRDTNSNRELPEVEMLSFTTVYPKDPKTGRPDVGAAYCVFIVDPKKHGDQYKTILKRLEELKQNRKNRLFDDEGFFKDRNPEAFRLAKEKSDLEDKISERDRKIAELESRLGLKK